MKRSINKYLNIALTVGALLASWSGATFAAPFELSAPQFERPSVNVPVPEDNKPCLCELRDGKWVCTPVGCGTFEPQATFKQQPIQRTTLPGDQYQPKTQFPDDPPYLKGRR